MGIKPSMKLTQAVETAYKSALKARLNAHAPYSNFKVGAAFGLKGESKPVAGCNVENASYGGTICAERVALNAAVAQYGKITPEFLVVVTGEAKATVPCALCLQSLAEFCADGMPIYLANEKGIQRQVKLKDLLPEPFRSFKAGK